MSDVRGVFITAEVSRQLDITPAYLIRLAKSLNLPESDFRETTKGSYLFNQNAVDVIKSKLKRK
nr:MAG TPA_asm: helix-turn-helix domain protein [Caudoviricetes sp.]